MRMTIRFIFRSVDSVSPVTIPRKEACLLGIATWMSLNKRKLNGDKTELLIIRSHNLSASQLFVNLHFFISGISLGF